MDPVKAFAAFHDILDQIEDERMMNCRACDARWYTIHYKDGLCHQCQRLELPHSNVRQYLNLAADCVLAALLLPFLLLLPVYWYLQKKLEKRHEH